MRAGLSTIQQTLTPEAASVLSQSISEAARRSHGQTTPLHVAASLLASPSGFLRQACIKSHPNSSHPLQCRALELCFSVALERLPTVTTASLPEPPLSNALMAALKRAQAHQRRGCPEIQQQPILAVKVELEQLVISILDDPSVSRVMREASFSSPAVKAAIERSLSGPPNPTAGIEPLSNQLGIRPVQSRNLYLNPRLQQNGAVQSGEQGSEDVKRVRDVLLKTKKRNPVLVGESEPGRVVSEVVKRLESGEFVVGSVRNLGFLHLEKELGHDKVRISEKIKGLSGLVETRLKNSDCGGIILDLGDLKWLVEQNSTSSGMAQQQPQAGGEAGSDTVSEMKKLLERFRDRLWFVGIATCETYLRCQIYYPSMENDWDLQAVPLPARAPLPGAFPRLGNTGMLSTKVETLSPLKGLSSVTTAPNNPMGMNTVLNQTMKCCHQCVKQYEKERADLERSSSEVKPEEAQQKLPRWLQNAKAADQDVKTSYQTTSKDQELLLRRRTQELQKKWNEACLRLHPKHHHRPNLLLSERIVPAPISISGSYNVNPLLRQNLQPKPQLNRQLGESLQLSSNPPKSPPLSPVRTDLVLGGPKVTEVTETHEEHVRNFLGCISSEQQKKIQAFATEKLRNSLDIDLFKKLLKGLSEKVSWQHDAAAAVAGTVSQCKLGNGKRRGGDIWLLFTGPDRSGKRKMASALSEVLYGVDPITISFGSRRDNGEPDLGFRGQTILDRIAETVRRSPFSVVVLEDFEEANVLLHGSIKRAMERGRLSDSSGREISLGNVIFVLTGNFTTNREESIRNYPINETKLWDLVTGGWQLKLSVCKKSLKRGPSWIYEDERRPRKPRTEISLGIAFDLNETANVDDDDKADGSYNSSDLTIEHDQETQHAIIPSAHRELISFVDDTVTFKPVDFIPIKREVSDSLSKTFSTISNHDLSFEIHNDALVRMTGAVWLGQKGLEEWTEKVFVPSLHELKQQLSSVARDGAAVVRLELDGEAEGQRPGHLLPGWIRVVVD